MENYGYVEYGFAATRNSQGELIQAEAEPNFWNGIGDWEVINYFVPKGAILPQVWTGFGEGETAIFESGHFRLLDSVEHTYDDVLTYKKRVPFLGVRIVKEVTQRTVTKHLKDETLARWCYWRTTKGIVVRGRQTNYIQIAMQETFLTGAEVWAIVDVRFGNNNLFPILNSS